MPHQRIVIAMNDQQPLPSLETLKDAALRYLARYAATQTGVRRVLSRRLEKWFREHPDTAPETRRQLAALVDQVIVGLLRAGVIDDKAYAETRARSLLRDGKSARSARATLMAKGVPPDMASAAVGDDPDAELAAILVAARRRRIGPFAQEQPGKRSDPTKALMRLIRAGFAPELARRAMEMSLEDAEALIFEARR